MTIVDLSAEAYHQDAIGDTPTLSASIAKLLVSSSPRHAWANHPRLNPAFKRVDEERFDVGTFAHSILLEGNWDGVGVVESPDWRTKYAKEQRDEIRAAGKIPLLGKNYDEVAAMVKAVREQLPTLEADPPLLVDGKPEQTIVWEDHGVTCRVLIDWLHDDYTAIDDVKTASRSANPAVWKRTLYGMDADVQVAFNKRAVKAATGVDPDFRFLVIETAPPFELSVVALSPQALALANDRMDHALHVWKRCLDTGDWPGYDRRVHYVDMPGYLEAAWMEKDGLSEVAA